MPTNVKIKVRLFLRSVFSSEIVNLWTRPLVIGGNPMIFMLRTKYFGLSRRCETFADLYDGVQLIYSYQLLLLFYEFVFNKFLFLYSMQLIFHTHCLNLYNSIDSVVIDLLYSMICTQ